MIPPQKYQIIMATSNLSIIETDKLFVEISTEIFEQANNFLNFDHIRVRKDEHLTNSSRNIRCEMNQNYGTNKKLKDYSVWLRNFLVGVYNKHKDKNVSGPRIEILRYLFDIAYKYTQKKEYVRSEPIYDTRLCSLVSILRLYDAKSEHCNPNLFNDVMVDIVTEASIMQDAPRGLMISNVLVLWHVNHSPRLNRLYFQALDYYRLFQDLGHKILTSEYSLDGGVTFNMDCISKWPRLMRHAYAKTRYHNDGDRTAIQTLFRQFRYVDFDECLMLDKRLTSFLVAIHMVDILFRKKQESECLKYVKLINNTLMKEITDIVPNALNLTTFYWIPFPNKTTMLRNLTASVSNVYDFMLLEQVLPCDLHWPEGNVSQ